MKEIPCPEFIQLDFEKENFLHNAEISILEGGTVMFICENNKCKKQFDYPPISFTSVLEPPIGVIEMKVCKECADTILNHKDYSVAFKSGKVTVKESK